MIKIPGALILLVPTSSKEVLAFVSYGLSSYVVSSASGRLAGPRCVVRGECHAGFAERGCTSPRPPGPAGRPGGPKAGRRTRGGGAIGSVSARASNGRCAELKPVVTQAASKKPSTAIVLRRSQPSSARAMARDLTEPGERRFRGAFTAGRKPTDSPGLAPF